MTTVVIQLTGSFSDQEHAEQGVDAMQKKLKKVLTDSWKAEITGWYGAL